MDACQNCHDGCDGRESGDQTEVHKLAFQQQCLMKVQALCWMRIL